MRVLNGQVFSHKLAVFGSDSFGVQAVLSSTLHQLWALKYGSTMRSDLNYSPSDVFETFPFPEVSDRAEWIGHVLDRERREIMSRRDLGLTKLYNLVNDPELVDSVDQDIARLRTIHVALDHIVLDAYGWADIVPEHGFHAYRQMRRWTIDSAARVEVLDRLLEENQRRADQEQRGEGSRSEIRATESDGTLFV